MQDVGVFGVEDIAGGSEVFVFVSGGAGRGVLGLFVVLSCGGGVGGVGVEAELLAKELRDGVHVEGEGTCWGFEASEASAEASTETSVRDVTEWVSSTSTVRNAMASVRSSTVTMSSPAAA